MDVDTGYVVNGPTLILDDASGEGKTKTYRCKAENVVSGEKKIASEDIQIHVASETFVRFSFYWHLLAYTCTCTSTWIKQFKYVCGNQSELHEILLHATLYLSGCRKIRAMLGFRSEAAKLQ